MATELFASNLATTTVSSGGTTAPAGGTSESWTVASSSGFGAAATGVSQFHVADTATGKNTEIIAVTNVSGTTWTVTRGAEGTTPVAHSAGFTIDQVATAGFLAGVLQLAGGTMAGSLGLPLKTVTTTNTTVAADWITLCNASGGGFTNTLPDATAVLPGASYMFKKADATANEVKLLPVSAQTVDGATYFVLAAANATVTLSSDGSNWQAF